LRAARQTGLQQYGALASDYSRRFAQKWFTEPLAEDPLGSSDFQSLADIGNSFRESVERIRLHLFYMHDLVLPIATALAPIVPLTLASIPVDQLMIKLLHFFLGGAGR